MAVDTEEMNIWVCGLDELSEYIGRHNPTHVLTVIDSDVEVKTREGIQWHRLNMWDFEYESPESEGPPQKHHVQSIIELANSFDKKNDRLIVHCWAGVSRSTAAAMIIMYVLYKRDIRQVMKKLMEIRPIASPNKLLCKYADEILNDGQPILLKQALKLDERYLINKGYFEE